MKSDFKYSIMALCRAEEFLTFGVRQALRAKKGADKTALGWKDSFLLAAEAMERHYVLSGVKGIDYAALKAEFAPRLEGCDETGDDANAYLIMREYCSRFHDGHVAVWPTKEHVDIGKAANDIAAGFDRGMTLALLDSGEVTAQMVDEAGPAYAAGIRAGYRINSIDGVHPAELSLEAKLVHSAFPPFAVSSNEPPYRVMLAAGMGGESADVCFTDADGVEKTVRIGSMGSYSGRLKGAVKRFCISHDLKDNLSWYIRGDHGVMIVNAEEMSAWREISGQYKKLSRMMSDMIRRMKAAGVRDLVLDLRHNEGGDDLMGMNILAPFTDRSFFYFADGRADGKGGFYTTRAFTLEGTGEWTDINIAVLVNAECVSAGDGLAYNAGKLDNVTLIGMTGSVCSFQAIGGANSIGHGKCKLVFPTLAQLDEDGGFMIDRPYGEGCIPLDVRIPVTAEAARLIYEEKADYELDYTFKYLESLR